jgi:membrane dipeptidase
MNWFDAHLDLAYLAVSGRDLRPTLSASAAACTGPHPPACVTLPALSMGGVTHALGTIFTEAVADGMLAEPQMYPQGDAARANAAGRAQVEAYQQLRRGGRIIAARAGASSTASAGQVRNPTGPLTLSLLMECADPIREPGELEWWTGLGGGLGVMMVGMAWVGPGRYAGGNRTELGLTDLGRALVKEMDRLGVIHDASHLSDRSFDELCEASAGLIVATHSNCRALLDGVSQRHLSDGQIRTIVERGGVIGLNLFSAFLDVKCAIGGRASIDDCVRHVEHVCEVAGSRTHVGLGSDMDGGFAADRLPEGIDGPEDLDRLADALSERGWSDDEVRGFAFENWARVLSPRAER